MDSLSLRFAFERETKNTVRFAELNDDGEVAIQGEFVVGTIYVQKSALGKNLPDVIEVTIGEEGAVEEPEVKKGRKAS